MEVLILMALACWGGGRYLVHTPARIAERRQRDTQTHQLRMQRLAQRRGPTISQAIGVRIANRIANPRGGPAREAIALWWADSWGYATARRLTRHELAEEGQLRRQRAARAAKQWLTAQWADLTGKANKTDSADAPEPVHGEASFSPVTGEDADIFDAEIVKDAPSGAPPEPDPTDKEKKETGRQTEQNPPGETGQNDEHNPDSYLAQVHPLRRHREESTVSTPTNTTIDTSITTGEAVDPAAARAFTSDMAAAEQQLYNKIELTVASLTQSGVSGDPITNLTAMQEAASVFIDRANAATAAFDRHLSTQDQVLSDPTLAGTVHGSYLGRG